MGSGHQNQQPNQKLQPVREKKNERRGRNVVGREWTSLFKPSGHSIARRRRMETGPPKRDEAAPPSSAMQLSEAVGPMSQSQCLAARGQPSAGIHSPATQRPSTPRSPPSTGSERTHSIGAANGTLCMRGRVQRMGWPISSHRAQWP